MSAVELQDAVKKPVLVGVLLNNRHIFYSLQPGAVRLRLMIESCQNQNAIPYLFSLKDVDYAGNMISGAYFDSGRGQWSSRLFSFPHVLYIRSGALDYRGKEFQHFLKAVKKFNICIINSLPAFNKWDIYRLLSRNQKFRPHLPETRYFSKHKSDLEMALRSMFQSYGGAYLKACRGRQGLQVMKIMQLSDGSYEYCYFAGRLIIRKVFNGNLYTMRQVINKFFGNQHFIIQQPIELLEIDGCKVDLRAEVQRNGRGELEIVAIPVRVGKKRSPITTHASSCRFEDFFSEQLGYNEVELNSLKQRIQDLLFSIYKALEEHYGPFGEIGIDIGLDKSGKLWFIECNAQSAKISLMKAYNESAVTRAFSNPLEYAVFIAGLKEGNKMNHK